jgi:hypothetical protein
MQCIAQSAADTIEIRDDIRSLSLQSCKQSPKESQHVERWAFRILAENEKGGGVGW